MEFGEDGIMPIDSIEYSVIIPAYNCAKTLPAAIASIHSSGLRNYEIIVVDDGSTDETGTVLDLIAKDNNNVVVIHQANGGVSSARNRALLVANGDYLLFLDADDLISEKAFHAVDEIIREEQPDMLLYGMWFDHYYLGTCYQTDRVVSPKHGLFHEDAWKPELERLFRCNYLSPIWNKVIRRTVITDNGVRFADNMFVMEDCRFSLDCLQYCRTIYLVSEPLYHYKITDDGKKSTARICRIGSLNDYMKHFLCLPDAFSGVVHAVYRMLLYQRIRAARTTAQLRNEAEDCKTGTFQLDSSREPPGFQALIAGEYRKVLCFNLKRRIRHRFVVIGKTLVVFFRRKTISKL